LQELHLKGNRLTVNALVELAKVIHLSSRDLKELDISNNEISIVTVSDTQKWKYFLHSFGQCCVLKKIDFSGNSLGTRGVEILARVYIRSELDFVEVVEEEEEEGEEDGGVPEDLMREHSSEGGAEAGVAGQGTKAARRG
jgi:Ran GTPase-activating protein (RanGAP) involved in mRNA processing and transport